MKKLLCLVLLILTAVCLSACSSCNDDNNSNNAGAGNNGGNVNAGDTNTGDNTTPDDQTCTVTLDLAGGSIEGSLTYTAELFKELKIPTPTKYGYSFNGWENNGKKVSLKPFAEVGSSVTLTATWVAKQYQVKYEFNGGTAIDENGLTVSYMTGLATYGTETIAPTPKKLGYEFVGWYLGDEKVELNPWNIDVGTIVLKAWWTEKTYNVKFDFNGGSLISGDESLTETYVEARYNRTIEFPSLKKNGFKFVGWSFDGEEIIASNLWVYTDVESPTLKAVYEPLSINYVFDADGGSCQLANGVIIYGASTEEIKLVTSTKEGYEFKCWTVDGEPIGEAFNYLPKNNKGSVVLKAEYTPNKYTLNLDAGELGTLPNGVTSIEVEFGVECDIPIPTPNDGYEFLGWKIKETGEYVASYSGKITWNQTSGKNLVARYVESAIYLNFIHYDGSVEIVRLEDVLNGGSIPIAKEKPGYFVSWELSDEEILSITETTEIRTVTSPKSFSIAFKNGTKTIFSTSYVYGEEVTLPVENDLIKKPGYSLLGWALDADDKTNYLSGTITWNIAQSRPIYAVWEPRTYKINYDVSSIKADYALYDTDGNMVSSVQEVTYGEYFSIYTLVARDDLIYVKWICEDPAFKEGEKWSYSKDLTLIPDITYNTKKQIEVNLNLNGGAGSTLVKFTLGKPFANISSKPIPQKGKKLVGYMYGSQLYTLTDLFLITDYDGTPFKCLYVDVLEFTINVDVNGGTGESTAIIEHGAKLSEMKNLPVPPSGMKLVAFEYNGIEYPISHVWEFATYDGGVFKAIYVEDDVDWSPTV